MNRIVKEHYPVSALPDDLQRAVAPATHVRVTIEAERAAAAPPPYASRLRELGIDLSKIRSVSLADIGSIATPRGTTAEEAVQRIRALRDEWDD